MSVVTYQFETAKAWIMDMVRGHFLASHPSPIGPYLSRMICKRFGVSVAKVFRHTDATHSIAYVAVGFASETDAVLFMLEHGEHFTNPRLVTDDAEGGPH